MGGIIILPKTKAAPNQAGRVAEVGRELGRKILVRELGQWKTMK
jgi:hypothetical protein